MISNLKIDQRRTFAGLVYLSCAPKFEMGSKQQATTRDGLLKWELQVLGATHPDQFGKSTNEVVKVGMTSASNPAEGIPPFTPVELGDFEVGVMEKTKKLPSGEEKIIGVTVWFRCSEIVNVAATRVDKVA
jgi:hypothetical protein